MVRPSATMGPWPIVPRNLDDRACFFKRNGVSDKLTAGALAY
jgi:hypothetical protein